VLYIRDGLLASSNGWTRVLGNDCRFLGFTGNTGRRERCVRNAIHVK